MARLSMLSFMGLILIMKLEILIPDTLPISDFLKKELNDWSGRI